MTLKREVVARRAETIIVVVLSAGAALTVGACAGAKPAPGSPQASASASGPAAAQTSPTASTRTSANVLAPAVEMASATPLPPAPAPTSSAAGTKAHESWAACHRNYKATAKDVSKDVASMARTCEKETKMKLVGTTLTGKQADQEKPQTFPLDAKAGRCYRVYAQAADGIKDLDLVVKDSAGIIVGQDSTDNPSPVVVEDGAVCFSKDDKASVVVSVGMGSGAYAVQIWGD